jgi:hypothetical protein
MHKVSLLDAAIRSSAWSESANPTHPSQIAIESGCSKRRQTGQLPKAQLVPPGARLVQTGNSPPANMVRHTANGASKI